MGYQPGDKVTYVDEAGEAHDAVVIDVFSRGDAAGPYLNLVYNPTRSEFHANTGNGLSYDTSVDHVDDSRGTARYYTDGWSYEHKLDGADAE